MARAKWCGDEIYSAAAVFKDSCLIGDGSLFTPGSRIWTADDLRAVEARVGIADLGEDSFIDKLEAQLDGRSSEQIQLAAELLYVLLLPELDTGGPKKREHVSRILQMLPAPIEIPTELDKALDAGGAANFAASKAYRDAHMRFLAKLVARLKDTDDDERRRIVAVPWEFRTLVTQVRTSTDGMQANSLLHLLFPQEFEYMVSEEHRRKLIEAFQAAPGVADAENADRKIARIRELASLGDDRALDLYEDPFQEIWKSEPSPRWVEVVAWSRRLYGRSDFDGTERDFKIDIAQQLAGAKDALHAGEEQWFKELSAAIKTRQNNLTDYRTDDRFLEWCKAHQPHAARLLKDLWGQGDAASKLRGFLTDLPDDAVRGAGTRVSFASLLLLAIDPRRYPFYKPTARYDLEKLLGLGGVSPMEIDPESIHRPDGLAARLGLDGRRVRDFLREAFPRAEPDEGAVWYLTPDQAQRVLDEFAADIDLEAGEATYAKWIALLEELRLRMLAAGTPLRDLLDAQGIAWWLTQNTAPDDWHEADRVAFKAFQKGAIVPPPPVKPPMDDARLPEITADLAAQLHLPQAWLQQLLFLLTEKKQLILYGPPGTGKTFVAQHIGRHITQHGGSTRLVQFHPSYTYEDFFEGYRPKHSDGGALSFDLVHGALREIAEDAHKNPSIPHLLIIDEINRGNIAKIFGELYFLLEYREEAIRLQYSRNEEFRLPKNLFVIGTMNTADRSIALVDGALRRRFYFEGMIPTRQPVSSVLKGWLAAHDLPPEPAALLAALNQAIDDEDFSIGPSYLITKDATPPNLELIWAHSVLPLLEEHYYGTGRDLEREFGLAAIRKRIAAAADASESESDDDRA